MQNYVALLVCIKVEKLKDSLEMVGDVLYLHHHGNLNTSTPSRELACHRVAYVGVAVFVMDLIKIMVPDSQVLYMHSVQPNAKIENKHSGANKLFVSLFQCVKLFWTTSVKAD